jgi:hypothetical protein
MPESVFVVKLWLYSMESFDDWLMTNWERQRRHGLTDVLLSYLPGGTFRNPWKPPSGLPISGAIFERRISRRYLQHPLLGRYHYTKRLAAGFPLRRPGFAPGSGKWDLWWTKWLRDRFSPSISVSPAKNRPFHQLLYPRNHPGQVE